MKQRILTIACLTLLSIGLESARAESTKYWVFFTDKGPAMMLKSDARISSRALQRRAFSASPCDISWDRGRRLRNFPADRSGSRFLPAIARSARTTKVAQRAPRRIARSGWSAHWLARRSPAAAGDKAPKPLPQARNAPDALSIRRASAVVKDWLRYQPRSPAR